MKNQMFRSGIWQLINVINYFIIQLFFIAVLSRYLSKSDWGLVAITNSINQFAFILSESGLGFALVYRKEVTNAHLSVTSFFNVLTAFAFAGLFYLMAGFFAREYGDPSLDLLVKFNSLNFIFRAFGLTSMFMLQKHMKFKELCITEVAANFISSAFGIYWAVLGWGVWAYIWSYIFMAILNAAGYMYFNRKHLVFMSKFTKRDFKDLFSFGFGQTLNRITNGYLNNGGGINFFIAKLITIAQTGIFDRTYRIVLLPINYLGKVLDRVMFAGMSKYNDDKQLMFDIFSKTLKMVADVAFALSVILIIYSHEIVFVMFGNKWSDAVLPLQILLATIPFSIFQVVAVSILRSQGLVYKTALFGFLNFIYLIILVFAGSHWGFLGVAVSILIASIIKYFNMLLIINKEYKRGYDLYYIHVLHSIPKMLAICIIILPLYKLFATLHLGRFAPMIVSGGFFTIVVSIILRYYPKILDPKILLLLNKIPVVKLIINKNRTSVKI